MALGKALKFIKDIRSDNDLRNSCYKYSTKGELLNEMEFNEYEFDDAINMNLVKCQTFDEAEEIYQVKLWFAML